MISIIVACDSEYGIGKDGKMPWRFPADFAYFKETTMGHPMITGRKNFEDMGALPGRKTIVLTRDKEYTSQNPNVLVESDLFMAIERAKWLDGGEEVFIVGGGQIYEMALLAGVADKVYLTHISRKSYDCDTFFQDSFLKENFNESHRTVRYTDEKNEERLEFIVYNKRKGDTPKDKKKTQ